MADGQATNMRDQHEPIETLLLDWHLGRLNEDDARRVEQALAESPGLAAQSGALGRVLHLLDRDEAVTAPADLAETVMHRINTQTGVIPMP